MKIKALCLLLFSFAIGRTQFASADPFVEIDDITANISDSISADVEIQLKQAPHLKSFVLENANDLDLNKLCSLYPGMIELQIQNGENITSLAPLSALGELRRLNLANCQAQDLSSIAGLTKLTDLTLECNIYDLAWMKRLTNLRSVTLSSENLVSFEGLPFLPLVTSISICGGQPRDLTALVQCLPNLKTLELREMILPDLSPLTKLGSLTDLNLYGSKISDFSALSGCEHLIRLCYYGTEASDYSSLGKLLQVQELEGGMTTLTDLSWIGGLSNLKSFTTVAEPIENLGPLAGTSLEKLILSELEGKRGEIDLRPVSKMSHLKDLRLLHVEQVKGSVSLGALRQLESLEVEGYNADSGIEQFDLAGAASWTRLVKLSLRNVDVLHFEALDGCRALKSVELNDIQGAGDLAALKKLPHLTSLALSGAFSKDAVRGFAPSVEIDQ